MTSFTRFPCTSPSGLLPRLSQAHPPAARYGAPMMYSFRDYAGRILKGAMAADFPVVQPTKFEFLINLQIAKTLGIQFSENLLSVADEVIE